MVRAVITESAGRWSWWLQVDVPGACDILVRGLGRHPSQAACRLALHRAAEAVELDALAVRSVQTRDGYWHVQFHDSCGRPVATSANQFFTARASALEIPRLVKALTTPRIVVAAI